MTATDEYIASWSNCDVVGSATSCGVRCVSANCFAAAHRPSTGTIGRATNMTLARYSDGVPANGSRG